MTVVNHSFTTGDQTTYGKGVITFTIQSTDSGGSSPIDLINDRIEIIAHGQPTGTAIKYTSTSGDAIEGIPVSYTHLTLPTKRIV